MKPPKHNDARDALDALLAGKPVPVEKTNVFGCSTKWADKSDSAKKAIEKWDAEPVSINPIDAAGVKALAAYEVKEAKDAKSGEEREARQGAAPASTCVSSTSGPPGAAPA